MVAPSQWPGQDSLSARHLSRRRIPEEEAVTKFPASLNLARRFEVQSGEFSRDSETENLAADSCCATIPSFPRGEREASSLSRECVVRGGRVSWRRNDRSIRSAPSAERTSGTPSEGRDAVRVVAPITHRSVLRLCDLPVARAPIRVPPPCGDETKYSRTDRFDVERIEREREEASTKGARRNATGLSSPLINTSKATCKAARVGSRVRLDSGNPHIPSNRPRASLSPLYLRMACLRHLFLSPPLDCTFFSHVHGKIRPIVDVSREVRILDDCYGNSPAARRYISHDRYDRKFGVCRKIGNFNGPLSARTYSFREIST